MFDDRARLRGMLDFEAALARAEAKAGVIPVTAAEPIAAQCRAELFDPRDLADGVAKSGNPAIPMVRRLTALVGAVDAEAARFVHWGATSQDAMDTGLVLQFRVALEIIDADLARLAEGLAGMASRHRSTPMVGRTWLQHALPVTFGLKAAGWLDAVRRHQDRLAELRPRLLTLQFGGAAGTLAALGDRGLDVAEALAAELDLILPATPWHAHRDRVVEFGVWLGMLTGTLGKIAHDVSLLMQTDVAEVFEPAGAGKGGSSTMPHKRNPVTAAAVLAASTRTPGLVATLLAAMPQEHERGLGNWHAEWLTLPDLAMTAMGGLRQMADMVPGLEVDPGRMRANLETTRGLIMAERVMMALGARMGRLKAHELVEHATRKAVAENRHLRDVLAEDPAVTNELAADELDRLFDPLGYVGQAATFVDRVIG
ncbi:3-carboxy-cis,cis-muconate cycloisomerase [Skermanella stibiiresistens SB22]|uniref:3-carboxy-cis,cis-muconate cycloisomerase n=1 Tax=Skermanella stibiiresistens SB22 TaxID=1385369 RepID=W9GRB6_9PROT|nr:3-carboxy-cis,cis-muconate cycloisomerase [Skermanella stibiiresistens SB22]